MGRLYEILAAHLRAQSYPVSQRQLADRLGVSPSTIDNWRNPRELIAKDHLVRVAEVCDRPYAEVRDALLWDIGYLEEDQEPVASSRGRRRDVDATAAAALHEARRRGAAEDQTSTRPQAPPKSSEA